MGDFRMTIEATGGHGCDRKAKAGDQLQGCGRMDCPDCVFAAFVSQMQRLSMRPFVATMHHWPADMNGHLFLPGADKCSRCNRTKEEIEKWNAERAANPEKFWGVTECGRNYTEQSEVVDDYSERNVKYPTGGFSRATGVRVKGNF